jgi:ubiquitin-protein ligase
MNPRQRRLQADFQKIMTGFAGHPHVAVEGVGPQPPERYRIIYNVPGLRLGTDNRVQRVTQHLVEIQLPAGYPREKPYCTVADPVFHPNFGAHICIADHWSPSQSLLDVIVQIGDMLQYKTFNTRSPLNAVAARWAVEHVDELPLAALDLFPLEPEIQLHGATNTTPAPLAAPAITSPGGQLS